MALNSEPQNATFALVTTPPTAALTAMGRLSILNDATTPLLYVQAEQPLGTPYGYGPIPLLSVADSVRLMSGSTVSNTAATLLTITPPAATCDMHVEVLWKASSTTDRGGGRTSAFFKMIAGTLTIVGVSVQVEAAQLDAALAGLALTWRANANLIELRSTGIIALTITYVGRCEATVF